MEQVPDDLGGGTRTVGIVAVDQDKDVSIDIGEHPPNHVTLALHAMVRDDSTGRRCASNREID
jgi:hypothetical protein